MRLDDEALAEGRLPGRRLLDSALPGQPVLLVRHCGHIAVASTAALDAAGIGPATPDPEGGSIDRDETGTPTGVLRETAITPVATALRARQAPLTAADLAAAVASLPAVGLTGLGAIVSLDEGLWGAGAPELDLVLDAASQMVLPLKVLVIASSPAELEGAARRLEDAGPMVSFLGLKAFADGSLGGHTAALRLPYADRPGETGTHRLDPDWAVEMIRAAASLGGMAAVHAIGDAALERVLDAMESAISSGVDPSLLRVEHVSVATPEHCRRLAGLGVTACIQPAFLPSDSPWLEARLGPERLRAAYPFRSLADAGVPLAGGSDCPVEPPHPLRGMAAARDRAGFLPEQALTADEALDLFTTGAARATGEDARLERGRPATFTVLAGDPAAVVAGRLAGDAGAGHLRQRRRRDTLTRHRRLEGMSGGPASAGGGGARDRTEPARRAVVGIAVLHGGALHPSAAPGATQGEEGVGRGHEGAIGAEQVGHQQPGARARGHPAHLCALQGTGTSSNGGSR